MNSQKNPFSPYLGASAVIDWQEAAIRQQAAALAAVDPLVTARNCYHFVRDAIDHSVDINAARVTCRASEVLAAGHGYCYAKSHLLAALLRVNGIPAGFDYQRLDDGDGHFMLHGLTTLYLPHYGWYRVDARGNKPGVDAQFTPPRERLAWPSTAPGEVDYRLNLAEPLQEVVKALGLPLTVQQLWSQLPTQIADGEV